MRRGRGAAPSPGWALCRFVCDEDARLPYGELKWVLAIVDRWREAAGVDQGAVLRA